MSGESQRPVVGFVFNMLSIFKNVFIGLAAFIGSVFGFGNKPIETPVPTPTPTLIVEELPTPTPKIIYITVTPKPTKTPTYTPALTPTPSPRQTGLIFDPVTGQVIGGNANKSTPVPTPIPAINYRDEVLRIINLTIEKERKMLDVVRNDIASMNRIVSVLSYTNEETLVLFKRLTELRVDRIQKMIPALEGLISSHIDMKGDVYAIQYITNYQYVRDLENNLTTINTTFNGYYNDTLNYNDQLSGVIAYITPNYKQSLIDSLNSISSQLEGLNSYFRYGF